MKELKIYTPEEVEKLLNSVNSFKNEVIDLSLEIEELKDKDAFVLGCQKYTESSGQTYDINRKTENTFFSIENKILKLEHKRRSLERENKRLLNAIETLPRMEKLIIELRFLKDLKWDTVAVQSYITVKNCIRNKNKAIEKISNFLNKSKCGTIS